MFKSVILRMVLVAILVTFQAVPLFSQETPSSFTTHKVKRGESLYDLSQKYNISIVQILEYNPSIEKVGLKKRMRLRIPVYEKIEVEKESQDNLEAYDTHLVQPEETKWRLAYQYGITIQQLDSLNPILKYGLKIGQQLKVPSVENKRIVPESDTAFNYYTVLPKEGYYRIEKKTGVSKAILDSLNPVLMKSGLQAGMILKIPGEKKGNFNIIDNLLVERLSLWDSIKRPRRVNMALMLPFKANEIDLDSIENVKAIFADRNLHQIAFDFYSGVRMAINKVLDIGISVRLSVFDTENNKWKMRAIVKENDLSSEDVIMGPLIPSNFDFISEQKQLSNVPKMAPLSANPVIPRRNVFQSVVQKESYRQRMLAFLKQELDTLHNVVIIADSLNWDIEKKLLAEFPRAVKLRPESNGYLLPEVVDSLITDSLPNKVIVESEYFPLISSVISQMSAQNSSEKEVQVYTTFRSNVYENENLYGKKMGNIRFTFASGHKPLNDENFSDFQMQYTRMYGKPPNRIAIRGFDLTLDTILRIAFSGSLLRSAPIGETEYQSNRFNYYPLSNEGFENNGIFILQHQDYGVVEVHK